MRLIILTWIYSILTCTAMATSIKLGGRSAFYDSGTDTWLCSVAKYMFGHDWTTTLSTDSATCWSDIALDGVPMDSNSLVTFTNIQADRQYLLTAVDSTGMPITLPICFTYLPVLHLQGDFNDDYQVTSIEVALPNAATQSMLARVKHRGATTNQPDRHKRNYHIKFINASDSSKMDRRFFGLRNDNSWILDAGQIDMLRIRNRVMTELWLDLCRKPYYADREPNALLGVRGDMVEVMLNDRYAGIYALTEAMDRKQMKLAKYEEPDSVTSGKFHGMLWKSKIPDIISRMTYFYGYNNSNDTWGGFEVKYPDPDDYLRTDFSTLGNAVRFVANSTNEEFRQHVGEYFDIPVIMDYWILINAVLAIDNGVKNIYWAVYDKQQDKKLTLAAWDLDCTVGQNWSNEPLHADNAAPDKNLGYFNNLFLRLHELNPDSFCIKAVERYQLLRKDLLDADSIYNRFEKRINYLKQCGAIARETARWSGDSDLSFNQLDFDAELAFIRNWLDVHLPYLDRTRFSPYIKGDVTRDGVVDIADINFLINKMLKASDHPTWYEDLSPDDIYDIADINQLINIILHQ